MIGDLSIAKLAFQQSSNSVEAQLVEARLGLAAATAAATGRDPAEALGDVPTATPPDRQKSAPVSLLVKVLDKTA